MALCLCPALQLDEQCARTLDVEIKLDHKANKSSVANALHKKVCGTASLLAGLRSLVPVSGEQMNKTAAAEALDNITTCCEQLSAKIGALDRRLSAVVATSAVDNDTFRERIEQQVQHIQSKLAVLPTWDDVDRLGDKFVTRVEAASNGISWRPEHRVAMDTAEHVSAALRARVRCESMNDYPLL